MNANDKMTKPVPLASVSETTGTGERGRTDALPPALPCDLEILSDDVLAALAVEAGREQERRKARKEAEFFEFVRENALALGVTPARLAATIAGKAAGRKRPSGGTDGRSRVKAKYRDLRSDRTWSGRGNAPSWFAEHIAAGGAEEDMRMPEGAV